MIHDSETQFAKWVKMVNPPLNQGGIQQAFTAGWYAGSDFAKEDKDKIESHVDIVVPTDRKELARLLVDKATSMLNMAERLIKDEV